MTRPLMGDPLPTDDSLRTLGTDYKDLNLFHRFIKFCAGHTGQLLNINSLASDTGISHTTAGNWISILEASHIIFLLQLYYKDISKRLVKSPMLYFYDVGVAAFLLGIENAFQVSRDPLRGNLFENMVIVEGLKYRFNQGKISNLYNNSDSKGSEVDLLLVNGADIFPIEIKPSMTVTREYFKGLRHNAKVFPNEISKGSSLVYTGDNKQQQTNVLVVPILHLQELFGVSQE